MSAVLQPRRSSASSAVNHGDLKPETGNKRAGPDEPGKLFVDQPAKRPRARKLKTAIGPFETECKYYDRGERRIEIAKITAKYIVYRLVGKREEYIIPHEVAFAKAVFQKVGFDAGPRESKRISRSTI